MQAPANDDQISLDNRLIESNDNDDDNVIVHRAIHHDNNVQFGTHQSNPQRLLIDNRQTVYIPIQLRCGVTVMCHQDIFRQLPPPPPQWFHQIRTILQTDVSYCLHILPVSVRSFIRRTKLWLNVQNYYYYDPQTNQPIYVNHTTTHHHVAWLQCARDRPDKVLGIEIYNMYDYIRMRHHWNGSGLLLHEYCHLIHQQVFGLDSTRIQTLYQQAQQSQLYHTVLRRDWAGGGGSNGIDTDLAYCMMDCKEFFAELSVTYLAQHAMFRHLDTACSSQMEDCSPPITEPTVLQRIRNNVNMNRSMVSSTTNGQDSPFIAKLIQTVKNYLICTTNGLTPHCNKFYPFTSGQFQYYDPLLFLEIQALWCDVSAWEDPHDDNGNNHRSISISENAVCLNCRWIHHVWKQQHEQSYDERKDIADVKKNLESPLISTATDDTVDL